MLSTVPLHAKCTRALTFQNWWQAALQQLSAQVQAEAHTNTQEEERIALLMDQCVLGMQAPVQGILHLCQTTESQVTHLDQALATRRDAAAGVDSRDDINWGQFVNDTQKKYSEIKGWMEELATRDGDLQGFLDTACRSKRDMTSVLVRRLQRVAGLQGRLLGCKKQATALLSAAKSERSRRLTQVEMVLGLAGTYDNWRLEVHHRNCFYEALLTQAEMVSAWVQAVVDKEEERRMEFLERMQAVLPQALLQLLNERPLSRGGGSGHAARAPRMEVHVSARAKRLPIVNPPQGALDAASLLVPLVAQAHDQDTPARSPPAARYAASDAEPSADRIAALEAHVANLERELEEKERLWQKANEGKADLEVRLHLALERLALQQSRCEAAVQGLSKISTSIGVTAVTGAGSSSSSEAGGRGRGRRSNRASGDAEGTPLSAPAHPLLEMHNLDAIVAAVQRLALHGGGVATVVRGGECRGEGGDEAQGVDLGPAGGGSRKDDKAEKGLEQYDKGEWGLEQDDKGERGLEQDLVRTTAELDKTKSLFSKAMLNSAALEMDIKKLQEHARSDKTKRQRLMGALVKIASLVGAPPPVSISPAVLPILPRSTSGESSRESHRLSGEGFFALTSNALVTCSSPASPALSAAGGAMSAQREHILLSDERAHSAMSAAGGGMSAVERRNSSRHAAALEDNPEALEMLVAAVSAAVGDAENPKISLSRFSEGQVALFMPCGEDILDMHGCTLYVAFNVNCPRHFLHPSSLRDFLAQDPVCVCVCERERVRDPASRADAGATWQHGYRNATCYCLGYIHTYIQYVYTYIHTYVYI